MLRQEGIKAGMVRPITLWPYPKAVLRKLADQAKFFLACEMSMGQMVEDVQLSVEGVKPVYFYGRRAATCRRRRRWSRPSSSGCEGVHAEGIRATQVAEREAVPLLSRAAATASSTA